MHRDNESPAQILQRLAQVLADEDCEPDDLIHAFGDVEVRRADISKLLESLLEHRVG